MPRYRLLRPLPDVVRFRNGELTFRLAQSTGGFDAAPEWRVYVERHKPRWEGVVLARAGSKAGLEQVLHTAFDVAAGAAEERVAECLVRLQIAERLE